MNKLSTGAVELLLSDTYVNASKTDPSKFSARVTTQSLEATTQFVAPLLEAVSSVAMLIFITLSLLYVSTSATIGTVLIIAPSLYLSYKVSRSRIHSISEGRLEADRMKHSLIQEILSNLRLLYLSNTAGYFPGRVRTTNDTIRHSEIVISQYSILPKLVIEGMAYMTLAIAGILFYRTASSSGILSIIPVVGAFAIGLQKMMPEVQRFYVSFTRMKYGAPAFFDIARDLVEIEKIKLANPPKVKITGFRSIDIDSLRYENRRTGGSLFETSESLQIKSGDKVGILGVSGAGKSTLLDIICGLISADAGHIRYSAGGGVFDFRDQVILDICYIPQVVTLLNGSLAYNIALKEDLSDAEGMLIQTAIKKANIDPIKFAEPDSVMFSDNGKGLSGGERQRIGLARAFFQSSEITILDEATSAIDKETERALLSNISELKTVIYVTHNPDLLNFCNIVIRIAENRLTITRQDLSSMRGPVATATEN
jgi:ATP-binding cassette subfamily B protein